MKKNYKILFLFAVTTIFSLSTFAQTNIVSQSFEGGGTWTYSEFPNPYTVYSPPTDVWGICGDSYVATPGTPWVYNTGEVVAPFFGNISSASEGNHYFGCRDIQNPYTNTVSFPADPGNLWHTINFDVVALPGGGGFPIKVAFDYYTDGFDGSDYIGWEIAWDNDTIWSGLTTTNYSNTDAWVTEEFTAPPGATHVRLRVAAKQNGGTDFGAFDNFRVFLDVGDLTPPVVTGVSVVDASTLLVTTSEEVTNGSDITNYSGVVVSNSSVNASGDSITLNLATPLVVGQYTGVYIGGLVDLATNVMLNDTFSVIFNDADFSSGLTITELMYNDPGTYNNLAYIEIYNNGASTIPLGGIRIDDAISFEFPEFDLLSGEYVILAKGAFSGTSPCNTYPAGCGFETFFGFAPNFEWWTGSLSTAGEQITFVNTQGGTVVDLNYDNSWAGGQGDGDGYSIVRCDASSDINDGANWSAATTIANSACGACNVGLGIGNTIIFAHPMADCPVGDITPPIVNGYYIVDATTIGVYFNEDISGADTSNFMCTSGNPSSVNLIGTDSLEVTLVNPMPVGVTVSFTIMGISDLAGNIMDSTTYTLIYNDMLGDLVITEISYNDPGQYDNVEFIEVYNNGMTALPLGGLSFMSGIYYDFPEFSLQAGDYYIIAKPAYSGWSGGCDTLQYGCGFQHVFGFAPDGEFQFGSSLSNSGETISIENSIGGVVDEVTYDDAWVGGLTDGFGPSLSLCNLSADNNLESSWLAATTPVNQLCGVCPSTLVNSAYTFMANPWMSDGGCVLGCTDPIASNYNVNATLDDGSCIIMDCAGIINGTAIVDSCGSCQQAYLYDFVVHVATFVDDANTVTPGPTEWLILANDPSNPYWNSSCSGCTDPIADNYDPNATLDNGTCTYSGGGCTDPNAVNYDASATVDDGSCCFAGCMDATAYNYDVLACADDGSCIYSPPGMVNLFFSEFAEGSSNNKYFEIYNPSLDTVFLSDYAYPSVANAPNAPGVYEYWNDFDVGAFIAPGDVYVVAHGSADPAILAEADETHNYLSNGDDGYGLVYGSNPGSPMDPIAGGYVILDFIGDWNGDPGAGWSVAGISDATKDHTLVRKCNIISGNIDWLSSAGVDSLSSEWMVYPQNYWNDLGFFTSCAVLGCTDANATNYDPSANIDDGSCTYTTDCAGIVNGTASIDDCGVCNQAYLYNFILHIVTYVDNANILIPGVDYDPAQEMVVMPGDPGDINWNSSCSGCTDPTACNYDAAATLDDGSCLTAYGCTDATACNYNALATCDDGSCDLPSGCDDPLFLEYDASVTCPDASACITLIVNGCTDVTACNYDPNANVDDGSCTYPAQYYDCNGVCINDTDGDGICDELEIPGCMDISACNYNPSATDDDGSCILPDGCTDATASNYDASALCDDGSCCYDDWVTITLSDAYGDGWNGNSVTINGLDYALCDVNGDCSTTNEWTTHPGGTLGVFNACLDLSGCIDVVYNPTGSYQFENSWTVTDAAGNVLNSGTGSGVSFASNFGAGCPVYGCIDPTACNYDVSANTDDGSCILPDGCTDSTAFNYDPAAICDDGSCIAIALGCTDATAINYDAMANTDDGSCQYCSIDVSVISIDPSSVYTCDGSALAIVSNNIGDVTYTWYSSGVALGTNDYFIDGLCGGTYTVEVTDTAGCTLTETFIITQNGVVYGCTDTSAANYDATATIDDGSCLYCSLTVSANVVQNSSANACDGIATILATSNYGAITYTWSNGNNTFYDQTLCTGIYTVVVSDGLCSMTIDILIGQVYGCTDPIACNYDPAANNDDGSCNLPDGCTDVTACNYDASALCDDGSCILPDGCTDPLACNYDASALCDDGSCILPDGCTDPTACNYDPAALCDDGSCLTDYGCTDPTQQNYDPTATCDDGSCIPFTYGCMDSTAVNYNPSVTADDGSCLYTGCTDPAADNYDANADIDDGSCAYSGCTDSLANNYDPSATIDDGSCTYPANCGADVTGMFVSDIIDDRAVFNWDNMNTYDANGNQICRVDQLRIKYRPVGTATWFWAGMGDPLGYDANGFCNSTQVTSKTRYQLDMNTTYEWWMRAWYCDGSVANWAEGPQFTTAPECPVVGNLSVVPFTNPNNGISKADFSWDDSNGSYVFCRIKMRIDSISNPVAADWINVGGGSVPYGTFTATKYGLTPGESYRAQAKGHCDPTGHPAYNSLTWTPLIFWTQPSIRVEGGTAIADLDVYPNPSRDVFNVTFTSEDVQDLEVRVINVVGEVVYTEGLQQFVGEYTKQIDLTTNAKGIYFLEIETDDGVINKKLVLQ